MFKSYLLNVFIAIVFFLSQVVNVNANHLNNSPPKEDISVSVIKEEKKKAISMAAFYIPGLNYGSENKDTTEGKIVKVFEPISIGVFTTVGSIAIGILAGFIPAIFTAIIGWAMGRK